MIDRSGNTPQLSKSPFTISELLHGDLLHWSLLRDAWMVLLERGDCRERRGVSTDGLEHWLDGAMDAMIASTVGFSSVNRQFLLQRSTNDGSSSSDST